jgi:hypothetical protein
MSLYFRLPLLRSAYDKGDNNRGDLLQVIKCDKRR